MRRYLTCLRTRICTVLIAFVLCSLSLDSDAALESCMWGTYLTRHGSGVDMCDVCEDGTFMPDTDHKHRQCYNCSRVVNATIEVIIRPCDIYQDAIIQCIDGYYRRRARNGRDVDKCTLCSPCENATRKCMNYTDTVCCLPNYDAVQSFTDADAFHCEERPCRFGEHFNTKTDQCEPCPQGTYIPQDVHKHMSCLKCARLEHSSTYHSRILHDCTPQSPTIFGCMKGYYRNLTDQSLTTEAMCALCMEHTECKCGVNRTCSDIGDTICNACEDPPSGVTKSAGSTEVSYPDRQCCEHVNCECQPRYVNGSRCECSDCPKNYITSTYGLETPICDNKSDNKETLCLTLCTILPAITVIIAITVACSIMKHKKKTKFHGRALMQTMTN